VLQAPPWWTLKRVLWIAGVLGFVALAAFSWVVVLRRQVTERTRSWKFRFTNGNGPNAEREIEQERSRVAHDLHDDLGARLTEVNMLSSLVKSPTTSAEEKSRYLDQNRARRRDMVTSLDEIVWAVNPRNDTMPRWPVISVRMRSGCWTWPRVSCGLDVAEDLPGHPLDPKFRQELFLAFKEALTNVVRHATATQVWVRISVLNGQLTVVVADNGTRVGSAVNARAGDDGMANMADRLKSLGGDCNITSSPQKGTTVRFQAPLPKRLL
jgi:signal transduction histidine kinase